MLKRFEVGLYIFYTMDDKNKIKIKTFFLGVVFDMFSYI